MNQLRTEALKLYRHSLRSLADLPAAHSTVFKRKLAYNYREIFEIHRNDTDEDNVRKLISNGWNDVETMKAIFSLNSDIVSKLFPLFDVSNDAMQEESTAESSSTKY